MKRLWRWLDNNILFILACFLVAFVPLMPKIPLADILPGYIVRLRSEDLVIAGAAVIGFIWALRGKVNWKLPIWKLIVAYLVVGLFSILSGVFLIKTIPLELLHIGKAVLHWLRYGEYFVLAFLLFSAVKTKKQVKIISWILMITLLLTSIYGFGQKYAYWPVYSTMNREFSKGIRLVLTPHARVNSTFAGHYDLAAWLVIMLPLSLAIWLTSQDKKLKVMAAVANVAGLWLLMVSGSRISYGGALVALFLLILILAYQKGQLWRQRLFYAARTGILYFLLVFALTFTFGQEMIDRFFHVLEQNPIAHDAYHFINDKRKIVFEQWLPKLFGETPPENTIAVNLDDVMTVSDSQPKPKDVYVDVPDRITVATTSAEGTRSTMVIEVPRTWSENAEKYGLSMAIRLDTLWPNALRGWQRNFLLGSGYGMLSKGEDLVLLTDADSTDNNLLRTLGETGLAGFVFFYGMIVVAMVAACKLLAAPDWETRAIASSYVSLASGILINALFIDVFAASKVAMSFWALTGFFYATRELANQTPVKKEEKRKQSEKKTK